MIKVLAVIMLSLGFVNFSYAQAQIEITEGWVRGTPPGTTITAMYMNVENKGDQDDALIGVSSNISKSAEIHQTSVDDKGVAKMEMVESVSIPAGGSVHFKPGGMHIMLIDLKEPLKSGDEVEIELVFEKAGKIKVQAEVLGVGESRDRHND